MSNPLYRAQRCRHLAEECRAIAALCTPSTEMRTHYIRECQSITARWLRPRSWACWPTAVSQFDSSDLADGVFADAAYR